MAFGKKPDFKKKPAQNPLFKRKRYCRFTVAGVEQIDYKEVDTLKYYIGENAKIDNLVQIAMLDLQFYNSTFDRFDVFCVDHGY